MSGQPHSGRYLGRYVMEGRGEGAISVFQETPADDNELCILKCQALEKRTAGIRLGISILQFLINSQSNNTDRT